MAIKRDYNTVKERLFWSYANLAMAHTAVDRKQEKYATFNYMIRAKLYKGLCDGTMNVRTLFDDEKIKFLSGQKCSYCGSTNNLALDHIFPQKFGGQDAGDNLVYACRSCNSSKGKKDLMEWMTAQKQFPPLMIWVWLFCIFKNCLVILSSFHSGSRNNHLIILNLLRLSCGS
jgi:hypothetical protein